jgi:hypothetical protein
VIQLQTYVELGATASDDVDGFFPATISSASVIDTLVETVVGSPHVITYSAKDAAGNRAVNVTR